MAQARVYSPRLNLGLAFQGSADQLLLALRLLSYLKVPTVLDLPPCQKPSMRRCWEEHSHYTFANARAAAG